MRELRCHKKYLLPDGVRPVFPLRAGGGYYLYDAVYGSGLPPRFEVKPDGMIMDWHGRPTGWSVEDLTETDEIARR